MLCKTYDQYFDGEALSDPHPMVPVGFIEKVLHLRVCLKADGSFDRASVQQADNRFPVPSSPAAEGRTGNKPAPYPLSDELRYVAGDLNAYLDGDYSAYHTAYMEQMQAWCACAHAPTSLRAVCKYLEQNRLVADLVSAGVLFVNTDGKLLRKWPERGEKPAFFKLNTDPEKCFLDFAVLQDYEFVPLRAQAEVQSSWSAYLTDAMPGRALCYVTGEQRPAASSHPKLEGNAKLISAKDGVFQFQYRGRFTESGEASSVSFEVSAKAHNALRWLTARQGFHRFGISFVTWSPTCRPVIRPQDEPEAYVQPEEDQAIPPMTEEAYAARLERARRGYESDLVYQSESPIVMLGYEAATLGRISITYYQEQTGADYLARLTRWYETCAWLITRQRHKDDAVKTYVRTPTVYELACAVFGRGSVDAAFADTQEEKSGTKLIRKFYMELFACIANGGSVPIEYARMAFHRALKPQSFTRKERWNRDAWIASIETTCAIWRNINYREGYHVSLDIKNQDRSYLFGRLLAMADYIEFIALSKDEQHRQTNAVRYFTAIQQRPAATWLTIVNRMVPYLKRLEPKKAQWCQAQIDEIMNSFKPGEFAARTPLAPLFLEGYYCQRYELIHNKKENTSEMTKQAEGEDKE